MTASLIWQALGVTQYKQVNNCFVVKYTVNVDGVYIGWILDREDRQIYNIFQGLKLQEVDSVAVSGWVILMDNPKFLALDSHQQVDGFQIIAASVGAIMRDKKKKAHFWRQWQEVAKSLV